VGHKTFFDSSGMLLYNKKMCAAASCAAVLIAEQLIALL